MFTANQIQELMADIEALYISIEDDLLVNVAKRFSVTDEVTPDTVLAWQVDKLNQMGALRKENLSVLKKYSGKTVKEIERILNEAGFLALEYDESIYEKAHSAGLLDTVPLPVKSSPALRAVLQGAFDNTRKYFNLINTTALESANKEFVSIINQTYLETSLGITDYNTAIRKAVRNLADKGITGARYRSAKGKETTAHMDVAVRRCIVTSTAQTAGVMQEQRAKEWGSNLVEVSSHAGSRPEHARWQGRIFSLEGGTEKYPNLREVTHYGDVAGLCGANCRHYFFPFIEGISEQTFKPYDLKEDKKVYEESQQQRKFEREIREQKRRILTADQIGDKEGKLKAQLMLKDKEQQLKAFTEKTGRTLRTNRQQLDQFGRSEAQKAVWKKKNLDFIKNDATIKANSELPSKVNLPDEKLKHTVKVSIDPGNGKLKNGLNGVVPKGSNLTEVYTMAGNGTSTPIRDLARLHKVYGLNPKGWQKKSGTSYTSNFKYVIHWYENNGVIPIDEIKLKGVGTV